MRFVLGGSHGIVFPWVLPPQVPLPIARALRDDLEGELTEAVKSIFTTFRSQASSPEASVIENMGTHGDFIEEIQAELQSIEAASNQSPAPQGSPSSQE